ncbi:MAG: sigma factor regulator FecR [Spirochaetes bacterium]|nr:sigma factor regulator FecR [Spirochaetota bacterium]
MSLQVTQFIQLIRSHHKIAGFTGAGISTDSGISDYRSKGGIWDRFQPVYFDEFLASEEKRLIYWERKIELWNSLKQAQPNAAHLFFRQLEKRKKLLALITQNIDGLHKKAGTSREKIIRLHGTNLEVTCLDCKKIFSAEQIFDQIDLTKGAPRCEHCNGLLKPNTISFGQPLSQLSLDKAKDISLSCDLMIVIGSTLLVQPASFFPELAVQRGAKLVIINLSETPLDHQAELVIKENCSSFLKEVSPYI